MKTLIAALAACFVSATAHAEVSALPVAAPEMYRLKQIEINESSTVLPAGKIASGILAINKEDRQIILTLQPAWQCPPGAMCAMVMPQPIVLALPIVYEGGGFAGGRIVVGEANDITVDGTIVRIEIMEGMAMMGPDPVFEPIQVIVSETLPGSSDAIVSTMQAIPAQR